MAETEERTENRWQSTATGISPVLRQLIFVLLGVIVYFVLFAVMPKPVRWSVLEPDLPELGVKAPLPLVWLFRGAELIRSPYVQVFAFLMLLFLAVYRRDRQKSWIYAFLVGFGLPAILFHFVLRWF